MRAWVLARLVCPTVERDTKTTVSVNLTAYIVPPTEDEERCNDRGMDLSVPAFGC